MRSFAYGSRLCSGSLACALFGMGCGGNAPDQGSHLDDAGMSTQVGMSHDAMAADAGSDDSLCPGLPPFKLGLEQLGQHNNIRAKLVSASPNPPLRYSNDWVVDFVTPGGDPVTDLDVQDAYTFMPSHGHNGTYKPTVTAESGPGRFKFKGFYFTMRGPWEVRFALGSKKAGDDMIIMNVCVGE